MSEPEKPKRRWFSFSLGTAVLFSLVLGGILWLNFHRYRPNSEYGFLAGWPIQARFIHEPHLNQDEVRFFLDDWMVYRCLKFWRPKTRIEPEGQLTLQGDDTSMINRLWTAPNLLTALVLLALTAVTSEFVMRRRESRKRSRSIIDDDPQQEESTGRRKAVIDEPTASVGVT